MLRDQLEATAAEMTASGGCVLPVVTDITDAAQVDAMVTTAETRFGPVDILVNNAGTFSAIGPVWEVDPARWFQDIRTNLYGTFLCCAAVLKSMVPRRKGCIINIATSGGVSDAHPYCTSYASSKTGLLRLTEGIAEEAREHGVTVFALAPPTVLTDMTKFIMSDPGGRKWRPWFKDIFAEGRDYPPQLVADMAVALASGSADALTGRYFDARRDLDAILEQTDRILQDDLLALRIREP